MRELAEKDRLLVRLDSCHPFACLFTSCCHPYCGDLPSHPLLIITLLLPGMPWPSQLRPHGYFDNGNCCRQQKPPAPFLAMAFSPPS
jgi:hypothetical protein